MNTHTMECICLIDFQIVEYGDCFCKMSVIERQKKRKEKTSSIYTIFMMQISSKNLFAAIKFLPKKGGSVLLGLRENTYSQAQAEARAQTIITESFHIQIIIDR